MNPKPERAMQTLASEIIESITPEEWEWLEQQGIPRKIVFLPPVSILPQWCESGSTPRRTAGSGRRQWLETVNGCAIEHYWEDGPEVTA